MDIVTAYDGQGLEAQWVVEPADAQQEPPTDWSAGDIAPQAALDSLSTFNRTMEWVLHGQGDNDLHPGSEDDPGRLVSDNNPQTASNSARQLGSTSEPVDADVEMASNSGSSLSLSASIVSFCAQLGGAHDPPRPPTFNGHGVVAQPIQFGLPRQSAQDQPLDPAAIEEYIAEAIEDLLGHQNGPGHDTAPPQRPDHGLTRKGREATKYCGYITNAQSTAARPAPRQKQNPKEPRMYGCPICDLGFTRANHVKRHFEGSPNRKSCVEKRGNPLGLFWDDHPSLPELPRN